MARAAGILASLVVVLASTLTTLNGSPSAAQSQAQDSRAGAALYGERCAVCHGGDARGANGPALVNLWASGATDDRVLRTIRQGVPGSAMPPSTAPDEDLQAIVAYLKTLAPPGAAAAGGRGTAPAQVPVTIVLRDGRRISGVRRGEDAFSIQIEDAQGRLQGYSKDGVQEIVRDATPVARARDAHPTVTTRDILAGLADPSRWLTFSGDYTGRRHSPLKQITPANVHRLAAQWTFQSGTTTRGRGFEATPLALDGVLYVTGSNNFAWALDARSGRPFWQYRRELPPDLTYGASAPVNRGFAILGDRLFMVTLDAHLLAFDRRSGEILWDTVLADYKIGYAATLAPLVVSGTGGDKVIVGISGGEYPTRGFLDAYNPQNGERIWRFYTVPAPGEAGSETWPASPEVLARGGGGTWMTGSYDPELNLLYWGTGNPNPDYWGAARLGDNLYTNSLIAIDADTGRLRWHYQFTPHDTHDWDSNHVPVLGTITVGGAERKVVMVANRNGFFYVLDRTSGALIAGKPFTDTTWAREIGADGRPVVLNDGSKGCLPDQWGGTNFNPPSFDPALQLFVVVARETCATYTPQAPKIAPGQTAMGGVVRVDRERPNYSALRALDAATGERRWEFRYASPAMSGVLTTASGLAFSGDNEGNFMAFDTRTGRNLWRYQTGNGIWGAAPMTFELDGRQYVLIPAGTTLVAFALPAESVAR
jgi:alcohol dehydrogenase (cytochrome c)